MATKKRPVHSEPAAPPDFTKDERFLSFLKQSAITAAEKDPDITTGRAAQLIHEIDGDMLSEIVNECIRVEAVELPEPMEGQEEEVAAASTHEGVRGPIQNIVKFIQGIDPDVKQKIIDTILKVIGLKLF